MTIREQIDERLNKIEQSTSDVETKYETIRSITRDLAIAIEELDTRIEQVEEDNGVVDSRIDGICGRLDRLEDNHENSEQDRAALAQRVTQLEDDAIDTPGVRTELELSKLERILLIDDENADGIIEERAVEIARHWREWSGSLPTKEYDSILSARKNNLKTHLEAARDERLQWIQIHRSMEALEEISDGKLELFEHERLGKTLAVPSESKLILEKSDAHSPID